MTSFKLFPPSPKNKKTLVGSVVWSPCYVLGFFKADLSRKEEKDLAMNVLFIIFRGWDLDLYFYSFKMPLFEILFLKKQTKKIINEK